MRKYLPASLISIFLLGIIFVVPVNFANAQGVVSKMILGTFDFVGVILSPLVIALVEVVSWITMLSGVVLNASIYYTVIAMSKNIGSLPAIDVTWTVIRDVANMGFIFMLLYSSIMTIVGKDKDTKGLIVRMIIAAVLVNFSLFFTKVVIDVMNLLALTFYKAIAPTALLGEANFLNAGLSNSIIDALGTQKLWQMYGSIDSSVVLTSSVMTIIVLIVTTFIFSAMAVMFIVRYVALIFVLVLSPIMFLSMVFPGLEVYAKKWKSTLIGQGVFAPVFMLMTWVTVILIQGISATVFTGMNSESLGNALSSTSFTVGAVPTLVNYVMIIIFLIASFTISKGFADQADGNINKLGKWAMGFAGDKTLGVAGRVGRTTIGRAGQAVADSEWLKDRAPNSMSARLALAAGRRGATATFDARNANTYKQISEATGVSFGKADAKISYSKMIKDKAEKEKEITEGLKPSDLAIKKAEQELEEAKKSGNAERISVAQGKLDRLKGVNEKDMKKREEEAIKNDTVVKDTVSEIEKVNADIKTRQDEIKKIQVPEFRKQKEEELKTIQDGLKKTNEKLEARKEEIKKMFRDDDGKTKTVTSAFNERKEAYVKDMESSSADILGFVTVPVPSDSRIMYFGPVSKEAKLAALDIRKKMKEKSKEEKLVDDIKKLTEDDKKKEGKPEEEPKPEKPEDGASAEESKK